MAKGKEVILISVTALMPRMGDHVDLMMDVKVQAEFRMHIQSCMTCRRIVSQMLLDCQTDLTEIKTIEPPDIKIIQQEPKGKPS